MNEIMISDHLKSNYDCYYEDGDSEWRKLGAIDKADNIARLCGNLPRRSIIEIGAGEGSILKQLSARGFAEELYAVEISGSGVATIEKKNIPLLVECKLFDGYHIPYTDNKFDVAILSHVIEHVEHPRLLLREAARIARHVFIEVPLEDTIRLSRDFVFDHVGHINEYSPRSLRRLVQSCDLRVTKQVTTNQSKATHVHLAGFTGAIGYYIKQILINMTPGIATRLFTYHGALVCERSETAPKQVSSTSKDTDNE